MLAFEANGLALLLISINAMVLLFVPVTVARPVCTCCSETVLPGL